MAQAWRWTTGLLATLVICLVAMQATAQTGTDDDDDDDGGPPPGVADTPPPVTPPAIPPGEVPERLAEIIARRALGLAPGQEGDRMGELREIQGRLVEDYASPGGRVRMMVPYLDGLYPDQGYEFAAGDPVIKAMAILNSDHVPEADPEPVAQMVVAQVLHDAGEHGRAWQMFGMALEEMEVYDSFYTEQTVARAMVQAGLAAHEAGDSQAGFEAIERGHQYAEVKLQADDPVLGYVKQIMAVAHFRAGDAESAFAVGEQAAGIFSGSLGPQHPQVGVILGNTAEYMAAMGQIEAADARFREALEILDASIGPDHPARGEIAGAYQRFLDAD